jgi:glycosyltransferase involved in cell wall biosynthesis
VEISSAAIRILRDKKLAIDLGREGRARVEEKFSSDRMVSGMIRVYEECLAKKG